MTFDPRQFPAPRHVEKPEPRWTYVSCPACGQSIIPSYNGFRRHLEFCSGSRLDPRDPHYFPKALMQSKPSVDSPLGDLTSGKIDRAEYQRRIDAKRARDGLPTAK